MRVRIVVAALLCAAAASAQDPGEHLTRANAAYDAGDFAAAIEGYRALLAAGHRHATLHYNLGNAYLRSGELGRAIASYQRAAVSAPRDRDVRANLEFARKNARDALEPPEPPAAMRTVFAWHYALAPGEAWVATALANLVLWWLLAARLWWRREWLAWAAWAAAVLVCAGVGSLVAREIRPQRVAVVVPREIDARAGTEEEDVVRFKLHAGSEVRVSEQRDGWLRIALPGGEQGWIEADAAEVVER